MGEPRRTWGNLGGFGEFWEAWGNQVTRRSQEQEEELLFPLNVEVLDVGPGVKAHPTARTGGLRGTWGGQEMDSQYSLGDPGGPKGIQGDPGSPGSTANPFPGLPGSP